MGSVHLYCLFRTMSMQITLQFSWRMLFSSVPHYTLLAMCSIKKMENGIIMIGLSGRYEQRVVSNFLWPIYYIPTKMEVHGGSQAVMLTSRSPFPQCSCH